MEGNELEYTTDKAGRSIRCDRCEENLGVKQYFDFCPSCWMSLSPQQRAVLRGEEPPVREVVIQRTETTRYPSMLSVRLFRFWCVAMTAGMAWVVFMVWKMK